MPHSPPTLLRGAQAGFLARELLLTVPTADDLLNVLSGPGLNTAPLTDPLVDRIRAGVAHPMIAAALATALFTGMTPRALLYYPEADALRVVCRPTEAELAPPRVLPISTWTELQNCGGRPDRFPAADWSGRSRTMQLWLLRQ